MSATTIEAEGPLKALRMAIDFYNRYNVDLSSLIHHSDRGVQYCSNLYVDMLKKHHINISMTQCGDPLHNALAERMNNTIKNGWLFDCEDVANICIFSYKCKTSGCKLH